MPTRGDTRDPSVTKALGNLQDRLAAYFGGQVQDASTRQDLVQRVNERVLQRYRGAGGIGEVDRFAFGVARRVLLEHWREAKRRRSAEATLSETAANRAATGATSTTTGVASRATMLAALNGCIEQLPEHDREIARRCYGEGKSKENRAALAAELGVSRNAVDVRISRIRAKLESCVREKLSGRDLGC